MVLHFTVFDSLQNSSPGMLIFLLDQITKNGKKSLLKEDNVPHKNLLN